jgi:small subunit ribosomal protein S13
MIYIFETELVETKSITLALADIYGLGFSTSNLISKKQGFLPNLKAKYLTKNQLNLLKQTVIQLNRELAGDLKKIKTLNIKRLISIKSYRGLRMFQGLPVRGQRTHSNARTAKKFKRK